MLIDSFSGHRVFIFPNYFRFEKAKTGLNQKERSERRKEAKKKIEKNIFFSAIA